jgi:hypothetical protein
VVALERLMDGVPCAGGVHILFEFPVEKRVTKRNIPSKFDNGQPCTGGRASIPQFRLPPIRTSEMFVPGASYRAKLLIPENLV